MKDEIVEIEEAVRKAQLAHDTEYFEEILADDFQFVTPQGEIVTKSEDIAQYKSGHLKMEKVEVRDRVINLYGTTAVVRFQVRFVGQAGKYSFSTHMRFTRVYSKISNNWKMVAGHSSELSES